MNKFEETVQEMKEEATELENDFEAKVDNLDDDTKEKAAALVEKTKAAIAASIEKIENAIDEVKDDEKIDEFLDKVRAKSKEAVEFTKDKIDSLVNKKQQKTLDDIHDEIMAEFDKIKENDAFKKTADLLKDFDTKINEFFGKPEIKDTIAKVKSTTIRVAEKGVEGLKKTLKTNQTTEEEASQPCQCQEEETCSCQEEKCEACQDNPEDKAE